MKHRIVSIFVVICLLMSAALPVMASEVVDTKYVYTPLPGYYHFTYGQNHTSHNSFPSSGGSFSHAVDSSLTNTGFKLKVNAAVSGQYDYLSFVISTQTDDISSVAGYLSNTSGQISTNCEYSVLSGSDLDESLGPYTITVLVDCSGFTGDVNIDLTGNVVEGKDNLFNIFITGYSVDSYSGVLVDYWDDTLDLLRQILAEQQKSNGFLSDIKTALSGLRTDVVNWLQEVYWGIQLNFTTFFDRFAEMKTSVDEFWNDVVYWFEETYGAIQLGLLNVVNKIETWGENIRSAILGEGYTEDDQFSEEADSIVQENQNIVDQIQQNTPTIPLDDLNPSDLISSMDGGFSAGPTLAFFFDGVLLMITGISLTFALMGFALFGKR